MLRTLVPILFLIILSVQASAHEFWIEPQQYQAESDTPLHADLIVGQKFKGTPRIYLDRKIKRFDLALGENIRPYEGRMGDTPALQTTATGDGLMVILHETRPERLKYKSWQDFAEFAAHKDFPDIKARHQARGLPEDGFVEHYSRHAKALIAIGSGMGEDRAFGLTTEFIALDNPYSEPSPDHISVRLLLDGAPRPDAQVEVFEMAPDGTVTINLLRTDSLGETDVPVRSGHRYLIDAVVLRPLDGDTDAVWESLWAALTFAVP